LVRLKVDVLVTTTTERGEACPLAVEQPTRFELVVKLETGESLGLTLPPSALARVDEIIE
jgi:hypothetical protein